MKGLEIRKKRFAELSLDELYGILRLRAEVFVVEQDCPYQDLDDNDQKALHIFSLMDGEIVACLRVFLKDDGNATIGRVVTSMKVRGTGHGKQMVMEGIASVRELFPDRVCVIHAQCYAIGFYEKCGFEVCSGEFLEDGIPHKEMSIQPIRSNDGEN